MDDRHADASVGKRAGWWEKAGYFTGVAVVAGAMILANDFARAHIGSGVPVLAMSVAAIYALMGLPLLIGGLFPRLGASLLEAEDVAEAREQRGLLLVNGGLFASIGLFLAAVTLGYGNSPVLTPATAAIIASIAFLIAIACNYATYRRIDELVYSITLQATLIATSIMLVVIGGWAALAALGLVAMFSPLLFLASFFALYLGCVLWVWYRRGLLE